MAAREQRGGQSPFGCRAAVTLSLDEGPISFAQGVIASWLYYSPAWKTVATSLARAWPW